MTARAVEAVLDASAVLALLQGEKGSASLSPIIEKSRISAVNFAEVISKLVDNEVPEDLASEIAFGLPFEIVPLDAALAERIGTLRARTRRLGLSLGDRACLALAERDNLPVLTTDRIWLKLDLGIEIRALR